LKNQTYLKYILIAFVLFFSACSIKSYERTQSKIITIKTKSLKFSDIGYIRNSRDSLELELFEAGNSAFKVSIDNYICTNDGCMSKSSFNEEYLSEDYPPDILQNIILGKPIYDANNLSRNDAGFEQNILTQEVNIHYQVDANQIYFKDSKNNILIKIKELNHVK
jgi:hypothetical protein